MVRGVVRGVVRDEVMGVVRVDFRMGLVGDTLP